MGEYYNIVPWYNTKEWHKLYSDIYLPTSNLKTKEEALRLLLIWKARSPLLPSGIESTLTLLEVYIQDSKHLDTTDDQMIRLAYSTSIMRFVNHMLDSQTAKGTSLYKAAKNLGVPDWIVDLRHDTAHGSSLPTIELLREATSFSLDWLKCNYWDKHQEFINDYVCGQISVDESDENKISALMSFCVSLSICAHSKLNIKNLADIPDINMRESIINDIQDLFEKGFDFSNLKKVSIRSLINLIDLNSKRLLKSKNTSFHVNKALLGKDSLFLSTELLHFLGDGKSRKSSGLSKHYIHCFEVLLTFLHTNDLLQDFILELIKITQCTSDNNQRRWLASVWISEILKALRKSSQFVQMMKKKHSPDLEKKNRKDLRSLFHHWFPSEKGCGLLLDLFKPVPKDLTNIMFVRPIISSYNAYLNYFIKDILNLIEPPLPSPIKDRICKLAKLISFSTKSPIISTPTKTYTVHDLRSATENDCRDATENNFVIDIDENPKILQDDDEFNLMETATNLVSKRTNYGIWQIVPKDYDWSTCPIGKLPWDEDGIMKKTEVNCNSAEHMETETI